MTQWWGWHYPPFMWQIVAVELNSTANITAAQSHIPLHKDKTAALSHINTQHRPCNSQPLSSHGSFLLY